MTCELPAALKRGDQWKVMWLRAAALFRRWRAHHGAAAAERYLN